MRTPSTAKGCSPRREPLNPQESPRRVLLMVGGLHGRAPAERLLNLQQLNIKQQRGIRRNDAACTAAPLAQ